MKVKISFLLLLSLILVMAACSVEPQPIKMGKDACSFCKMGFIDKRFGAELITKKGKVYKFDDLHCLLEFEKAATVKENDIARTFIVNYQEPHNFIELKEAFLFKSEAFRSPMGSDIAAFMTEKQLKETTTSLSGEIVQLNGLK